jgi:hypothetical protein
MNAVALPADQLPTTGQDGGAYEILMRAAKDPAIDAQKVRELWQIAREIRREQAEVAFNVAMTACQAEMPVVVGRTKNSQTGSFYAALEELDRVAKPIYTRHGFALSFGTADCPIQGWYRETCKVSHLDGHSENRFADLPPDLVGIKGNPNKTGVQGFGSTMSYGQRYLTKLIFNIVIAGEDKDGNRQGERVSEKQIADIRALLTELGKDEKKFLTWAKVGALSEIPAANYSEVIKTLEAMRR